MPSEPLVLLPDGGHVPRPARFSGDGQHHVLVCPTCEERGRRLATAEDQLAYADREIERLRTALDVVRLLTRNRAVLALVEGVLLRGEGHDAD